MDNLLRCNGGGGAVVVVTTIDSTTIDVAIGLQTTDARMVGVTVGCEGEGGR